MSLERMATPSETMAEPSESMDTPSARVHSADASDIRHLAYLDLAEVHPAAHFGDVTMHVPGSNVSGSDASTDDGAEETWTRRSYSGGVSRGSVNTVNGLETLLPRGLDLFGVHRQSLRRHFTSSRAAALYLPDGDEQRTHIYLSASLGAAARKVCLQLITLVAYGWREDLSSMPKGFLEILTAEGGEFRSWLCDAITMACSRNDEHMLRCLLSIYPPPQSKSNAGKRQTKSFDSEENLVYALTENGRIHYDQVAPGTLAILRRYFSEHGRMEDFLTGNTWGGTPLSDAVKECNTGLSHFLLAIIPPSYSQQLLSRTDRKGRTVLHFAAQSQNRETVRYMLSKLKDRRDVHPQDIFGLTPLMLAEDRDVMMEFSRWHGGPELYEYRFASCRSWTQHSTKTEMASVSRLLHHTSSKRRRQYQTISKDSETHSLRWFHFPANNIRWCEEFLTTWFVANAEPDVGGLKAARRAFDRQHTTRTWRDRYLQPGVQISYPVRSTQDMREETRQQRKSETDRRPPKNRQMFIAVPYTHFETMANLEELKKSLESASADRRASLPVATEDEKLYRAYADDSDFHPRRTLDQYFHPSMDTDARDCDQVVQRYQLNSRNLKSDARSMVTGRDQLDGGAKRRKDINTIMVDQLCIWVLSDKMLMTNFPQRWNKPDPDGFDFYQSFSEHWTTFYHPRPETASEVALLLMEHCFGTFDRHAQTNPNLQFMTMFEQSIGAIGAEESTKS
jgi:hypothetical protein